METVSIRDIENLDKVTLIFNGNPFSNLEIKNSVLLHNIHDLVIERGFFFEYESDLYLFIFDSETQNILQTGIYKVDKLETNNLILSSYNNDFNYTSIKKKQFTFEPYVIFKILIIPDMEYKKIIFFTFQDRKPPINGFLNDNSIKENSDDKTIYLQGKLDKIELAKNYLKEGKIMFDKEKLKKFLKLEKFELPIIKNKLKENFVKFSTTTQGGGKRKTKKNNNRKNNNKKMTSKRRKRQNKKHSKKTRNNRNNGRK